MEDWVCQTNVQRFNSWVKTQRQKTRNSNTLKKVKSNKPWELRKWNLGNE
jgi:hypothetical protein